MKNLPQLLTTINTVHSTLQTSAALAVNRALTIRNWLIGYYIVAYEQKGEDRAEYGDKVIDTLAVKLKEIKGMDRRSLFKFRQFYLSYEYLSETIQQFFKETSHLAVQISPLSIVESVTPQSENRLKVPADVLLSKISYTHLELLKVSDPLKRTFYELECIKEPGVYGN